MRYKRYEKYKDSGVEWIGEVPEHWEVIRLKFLKNSPFLYGANEASDTDEPNFPRYIRITDIDANGNLREDTFKSLPYEIAKPYLLKEGDILFARSGATVGKTFIYKKEWGKACFAGYLIKFEAKLSNTNPKFIYYFTQSRGYEDWIRENTIQATIQNVSAEKYGNLNVPFPKVEMQNKIVNFLDRKTSEIDSLIADKEKLIELLQERRQAIISEAVTKGLDRNVKMKDSGIEWIGEVPEHWEVSRFRRFCTLQQGLQIAQAERYYEPGEGRYEYITIKSLHSNDEDYIREYIKNPPLRVMCNEEDVLLARTGATGEVITGCNGVFHNNFFKVNYDRKRIIKEYLVIYLKQQSIKSHLQLVAGTTTIPDLNHGDFLDTPFIVPPMEEQKLIIEKVRSELLQVDEAIGIINIQIDRFKEYRQTLISEAVTGKIMV